MRVDTTPTMNWKDAPDTITPKDLANILGIGVESARTIFKRKDFPKISNNLIGNIGKADKEMARLYIQGIRLSGNTKDDLLSLIYLEIKNISSKINK